MEPKGMTRAVAVLAEVLAERGRQDAKWGEQDHPDLDPVLRGRSPERHAENLEMPTAARAKFICNSAFERKEGSYSVVALEEFAEAIEAAAAGDDQALRTELIQTAAVFVAWVECLDRRSARARPA